MRRSLGVGCAAAIAFVAAGVGCGAAADGGVTGEHDGLQSQAMAVTAPTAIGVTTGTGPATIATGTTPIATIADAGTTSGPTLSSTVSGGRSPTCTASNLTAVVRLPDADGASFAPFYQDGHSVAFPTPWVTEATNPKAPYVDEPDTYVYEHLLSAIASHETYEFLVNNIVADVCGYNSDHVAIYCEKSVDTRQFFLVGFTDPSQYSTAIKLADATPYQGYSSFAVEPNVDAKILTCVKVFDPPTSGSVLGATGYMFAFADEHDPGKNPF